MSRPNASERGYGMPWRKARAGWLKSHPHCSMCAAEGRQVPALHVHHNPPHRGDSKKFWDRSTWVGLCESHHNKDGQEQDRHGYRSAVGGDGLPLDRSHPFYSES